MVEFEGRPSVRWIPHGIFPSTFMASEAVAFEDCRPDTIGNLPVVFWKLPIAFENIDADGKFRAAGSLAGNIPPVFRPQFADTSCPFRIIAGDILQFFPGNLLADVLQKEIQNPIPGGAATITNRLRHIPTKGRIPVLIHIDQNIGIGCGKAEIEIRRYIGLLRKEKIAGKGSECVAR